MKTGFDGGMLSFFLSGASSFYLYRNTRNGAVGFRSSGKCGRGLILASHMIVCLNYALGTFLAFTIGDVVYFSFAYYCMIFFLVWLFCAMIGWNLVTNTLEIGDDDAANEDYGDAYDFSSGY